MKIKGALFDMDGVLLDSMPYWMTVPVEYMRKKGVEITPETMDSLRACTITEGSAFLRNEYGLKESVPQVLSEIREEIGYYYKNVIPLKPGVKEILCSMKECSVRLGVLTASDGKLARAALENNGVADYFDFIMDCSDAGYSKNTPESFLKAVEMLETTAADTVVFEDSLHAINASKEAGLYTVGIYDEAAESDRKEIIDGSDLYVDSLEDIAFENGRITGKKR